MKKSICIKMISLTLPVVLSLTALADNPKFAIREFPFQQSLNMDTVYQITKTQPDELIGFIKKFGIEILVVKTEKPVEKLNSLLIGLPFADHSLIKIADFRPKDDGTFLSKEDSCCDIKKDTILIRDTAYNYELIHEFLHSQLFANGRTKNRIGFKFLMAHKNLNFKQNKLASDGVNLTNELWRRDILSASKDYADLLYLKIQESHAEEIIIEKVLAKYIDQNNIYYEPNRVQQSKAYVESTYNNAADMFNSIHQYLTTNKGTVTALREAIEAKQLKPEFDSKLTQKDATDFIASINIIFNQIEPVKTEIFALRDLYSEK